MENIKNMDIEKSFKELEECFRIRTKLLKTTDKLTIEEKKFIKGKADAGSPLAEFTYGLYYLLNESDEKTAEEWWNKFFYHSNGDALWIASGIFAFLGDEYYDWSMKCLRRAAWRQHPIAKAMYKEMKENPYKFPEA
jgi:hypothetical protein